MIDPDKILVTGGGGLVGSCVTGTHKPRSSEVDLMNFNEIDSYIMLFIVQQESVVSKKTLRNQESSFIKICR